MYLPIHPVCFKRSAKLSFRCSAGCDVQVVRHGQRPAIERRPEGARVNEVATRRRVATKGPPTTPRERAPFSLGSMGGQTISGSVGFTGDTLARR